MWPWSLSDDLENNRASLLCYFKLCASFRSHSWIWTGVTVQMCPIWVKIGVFVPNDLEIWQMTLKNHRAPLPSYFKLCTSFRSHLWIQIWVTVQKCPNWGKICFDLCDLDLWPCLQMHGNCLIKQRLWNSRGSAEYHHKLIWPERAANEFAHQIWAQSNQ